MHRKRNLSSIAICKNFWPLLKWRYSDKILIIIIVTFVKCLILIFEALYIVTIITGHWIQLLFHTSVRALLLGKYFGQAPNYKCKQKSAPPPPSPILISLGDLPCGQVKHSALPVILLNSPSGHLMAAGELSGQ